MEKPIIRFDEKDPYGIMGRVKRALMRTGADTKTINQYIQESMSGNKDSLLPIARKYVTII